MSRAAPQPARLRFLRNHAGWLWSVLITAGGLLAYHNAFIGGFVFDDRGAILENPTIRHLWPPWDALSPPINGLPVTGRPVTNLSFALNHAVHGFDVLGYRVVNVAVHVLCALTLFGVVRRTLLRPRLRERFGAQAGAVAAAASLLWVVHPLTTAGVSYISQRAESLGSLFLLVSLYTFVRGVESPHSRQWFSACAAACWLGIATKEFNAAIPILVALYDRIFVASSWREIVRARGVFHTALVASWLPLAWLIGSTSNRGGTWAADSGFSAWDYALVQCHALVHYLRLVFWPEPLVFDYGRNLPIPRWVSVLPQAALLAGLLTAVAIGLRRWPAAAFAGVAFIAVLAPTSSFVPIADALFEHRMYLPSAVVIVLIVGGADHWLGRSAWVAFVPLAILLTVLSVRRNADYRTAVGLWEDTVAKMPENARAQANLGAELARANRHADALPHLQEAWRLMPNVPEVANDLAVALDFTGHRPEAIQYYREAIRLQPDNILAQMNLANALAHTGPTEEAFSIYADVVRQVPGSTPARTGYARALMRAGRSEEAITQFREAVRLEPTDPELHFNLGDALARSGRLAEAIPEFREVVHLRPDHRDALNNLGNALLLTRQTGAAIGAFRQALHLAPDRMTHTNLGYALLLEGRRQEAITQFEAAVRLDPDYRPARDGLARALGPGAVPPP